MKLEVQVELKQSRLWTSFNRLVDGFVPRLARSAARIFGQSCDHAGDVYGQTGSEAAALEVLVPMPWRIWLHDVWMLAVPAGGEWADEELLGKATRTALLEAAADYLQREGLKRAEGLTDYGRRVIKDQIRIGLNKGESPTKIAIRIHNKVARVKPSRARLIARNEIHAAMNYGSMVAAKQQGARRLSKVWVSKADGRVRDMHAEAHGQVVPVNTAFVVGGERLMYPGDGSLGASSGNLVNCRCAMAYQGGR